jgi:hypothetical protein
VAKELNVKNDMRGEVESSVELPPDDPLRGDWEQFLSLLYESGHRANARYAQLKYDGKDLNPQEVVDHLLKTYERTAALAVKTVTDHQSALAYSKDLDRFLKRILSLSSRLFRAKCQREPGTKLQAFCTELHRRLLARSEHWKAEAHKQVRLTGRANVPKTLKAKMVGLDDQVPAAPKKRGTAQSDSRPVASQILSSAMGRKGLNVPNLTVQLREMLRRKRQSKRTVDRSTVYRIITGTTKQPDPAIRNGLIEVLQLEGEEASTVRRELSRGGQKAKCQNS